MLLVESWLAVVEHGDDGVRSLSSWLSLDEALRGRVRPVRRPPAPDEMGTALDVLAVAVGSGGAVTVLAGALHAWLQQRRSTSVRVRVIGQDGSGIEIEAHNLPDVAQVEGLLRASLRAAPGD